MYQWINPHTGSSQLSGKAPAWYRSERGGPRVLVFEKNQIVDDTAIQVSEEQRIQLKEAAFAKKDESSERQAAVAKLEQQIEEMVESSELDDVVIESLSTTQIAPSKGEENEILDQNKSTSKPNLSEADQRVERLKALISAWDKKRTEEAKSLLNNQSEGAQAEIKIKQEKPKQEAE